jgi:integrase
MLVLTDSGFVSFSPHVNRAELIRRDLEAAKLPTKDREGNEIVFHSFRNISFLANSGTPFKVVQKLARHSAPKLTYNTYARTFEAAG